MNPEEIFEAIKSYLHESGFNLVVRIKSSEYDKIAAPKMSSDNFVTGARSIILAGFAGNKFWKLFQSFLDENPEFTDKYEDLIDTYTTLKFKHVPFILDTLRDSDYKTVFPFGKDGYDVDFVKLGKLGGAGVPSLLGILIHPEYGTWISLRGAVITTLEFEDYDRPLDTFNPCPSCSKPCIDACPANTISVRGWDWESCMRFRISRDICTDKCASRLICPYGNEHRYTDGQILYHHRFVLKSVKKYLRERCESGDKE